MEKKIFLESENGFFGEGESSFGGCFVPETLYPALHDLQKAYKQIFQTKGFKKELKSLFKTFVGRPTPLIYAKNASEILCNEIYIKFEGLANTGAHKINNALAQVLLAKRMGKKHIIAETGAGQHGVAVASVCAFLKMPCTIFMGEVDAQRQQPNVFIMQQFGAEVIRVDSGTKTLKDSVNEALRQWSIFPNDYFYVIGSALGPYPYPDIVRDAQSIIGKELKKQIQKTLSKKANTFLPDYIIACVGGGSNAIGTFSAFLEDMGVNLIGVEAGGENFKVNKNAMRLSNNSEARVGIAQGFKSYFLQDKHGQISNTYSISAGLDYAGVGPQIAHLADIKRIEFMAASDEQALEAMQFFARHEGILAALESSHALAGVIHIAKTQKNKIIVANVSGRGDKDIFITAKELCPIEWKNFLSLELQGLEKKVKQLEKNNKEEEVTQEKLNKNVEEFKKTLQSISQKDLEFLDFKETQSNISQSNDNTESIKTPKEHEILLDIMQENDNMENKDNHNDTEISDRLFDSIGNAESVVMQDELETKNIDSNGELDENILSFLYKTNDLDNTNTDFIDYNLESNDIEEIQTTQTELQNNNTNENILNDNVDYYNEESNNDKFSPLEFLKDDLELKKYDDNSKKQDTHISSYNEENENNTKQTINSNEIIEQIKYYNIESDESKKNKISSNELKEELKNINIKSSNIDNVKEIETKQNEILINEHLDSKFLESNIEQDELSTKHIDSNDEINDNILNFLYETNDLDNANIEFNDIESSNTDNNNSMNLESLLLEEKENNELKTNLATDDINITDKNIDSTIEDNNELTMPINEELIQTLGNTFNLDETNPNEINIMDIIDAEDSKNYNYKSEFDELLGIKTSDDLELQQDEVKEESISNKSIFIDIQDNIEQDVDNDDIDNSMRPLEMNILEQQDSHNINAIDNLESIEINKLQEIFEKIEDNIKQYDNAKQERQLQNIEYDNEKQEESLKNVNVIPQQKTTRVFETKPEFNKICSKSLKS